MDLDFCTRIDRHLILDHYNRPLSLVDVGQRAHCDTLMACIAYRVYQSHSLSKRVLLRQMLVTHFAFLVFGRTFQTIADLTKHMLSLNVKDGAITHSAIQAWCDHMNIKSNTMKEEAMRFVHKNAEPGHITCRYSMLHLFADRYHLTVYLYEAQHEREPLCIEPSANDACNKDYFVYIWYDGTSFHLLLPLNDHSFPNHVNMSWFRQSATTNHIQDTDHNVHYCLTRSYQNEVHHITYFAPPRDVTHHVHVAVVPLQEAWRTHRNQYFMVLPPRRLKRMHLHVPKGEALFVYCCTQDRMAYRIAHVSQTGEKAIFQLAPDVSLVMILSANTLQDANRAIEEEMKINVLQCHPK